jgi:hypothetical protein
MLTKTSIDLVPEYLKAVTIFQPEGNLAAEVANAVAVMVKRRHRRHRVILMQIATLLLLIVLAGSYWIEYHGKKVDVRLLNLTREKEGLPWEGDTFLATVEVQDHGTMLQNPLNLQPKSLTDGFKIEALTTDALSGKQHLLLQRLVWERADGSNGPLSENQLPKNLKWELTWVADDKNCAGKTMDWSPLGAFTPGVASPLGTNLFGRVRTVVACPLGFCLGLVNPNEAALVAPDGQSVLSCVSLPGEPIDSTIAGDSTFIATSFSNTVVCLSQHSFTSPEIISIPELSFSDTNGEVRFTSVPTSIVATTNDLWLITTDQGGQAGLIRRPAGEDWQIPSYTNYSDLIFDLDSVRLNKVNGKVLGITSSTPHYIYEFLPQKFIQYSGHDYPDSIGCFGAIASAKNGNIVGLGGDFQSIEVALLNNKVEVVHQGEGLGDSFPASLWDNEELIDSDDGLLVGMTEYERGQEFKVLQSSLLMLKGGEMSELIRRDDASIVALAVQGDSAIMVMRRSNNTFESYFLHLK